MQAIKVSRTIAGKELSIETGTLAKLAAGAVTVRYGDTIVFAAVARSNPREGIDFFPLAVEYRERTGAAGKFPGGYLKREGRPSNREVLISRLIDRPLRPLFPKGFFDEVQIQIGPLSFDNENDTDVLAGIAASAAIHISDIPFETPTAHIKVGKVDGKLILMPTLEENDDSDFELVIAGTKKYVNMIELQGREIAEDEVADAVEFGHAALTEIVDMIEELRTKTGSKPKTGNITKLEPEFVAAVKARVSKKIRDAKGSKPGKADRNAAVVVILKEMMAELAPPITNEKAGYLEVMQQKANEKKLKLAFSEIEEQITRELIIEGVRPDGRGAEDIRPISCSVGLLPRVHGSALFTRGETQSLCTVTLGTPSDEQKIDGLHPEYSQKFMLHYNFPSFSVGEVRPIRGLSRREIGHGNLAERSLLAVLPGVDEFPYTVKVTSDILESNGSSSMASSCGGCLALMDAGVPLSKMVAGISVGLVSENGKSVLITDILGEEDHFGDMDFKVCGTTDGITAIQLDIKTEGLDYKLIRDTLHRAKSARLKILDTMASVIDRPRNNLSDFAPRMLSIKIDPEKIGKIIGPGGKIIKKIQEDTGAKIDIEDDGTVFFSSVGDSDGRGGAERARGIVEAMTASVQPGRIYTGTVVSLKEFGAFVEIAPETDGLCHVSEFAEKYIQNVGDFVQVGDTFPVKVILIDDQGRIKLSRKAALKELGEEDTLTADAPERGSGGEGGGGGDRGGDRGDRPPRREGGGGGDRGGDRPRRPFGGR